MAGTARVVTLTPQGLVCAESGDLLTPPEDWSLLAPGDAALTRRVKQGGAHWVVQERRGRRVFSRGVWGPQGRIEQVRRSLLRERATPEYAHKLEASRERRAREQVDYVEDFRAAVVSFLDFAPPHHDLARRLADRVTAHTTPVGSGTVGRTQRIPIERKAEAAVIAWLRHRTTSYDQLEIPRVRGKRREVRRRLAKRSKQLLARFRTGDSIDPGDCPLQKALREEATRSAAPEKTTPRSEQSAPRPEQPAPRPPAKGPLWQTALSKR